MKERNKLKSSRLHVVQRGVDWVNSTPLVLTLSNTSASAALTSVFNLTSRFSCGVSANSNQSQLVCLPKAKAASGGTTNEFDKDGSEVG